jgi:hypothetical protein
LKVFGNTQSVLLILAALSASLSCLFLIRRFWPYQTRREHNDLIGWHVSVLGSTYAVIIGFMLFAVWTNFQVADSNADGEANSLVNLARSALGLSAPSSQEIVRLASEYADAMVTKEWPAMDREESSPYSGRIVHDLWAILAKVEVHNSREQICLDHCLSELGRMSELRRERQLQVNAYFPYILWLVLVLGAVVTVLSACLFGAPNLRLHLIQVVMLSLLISAVLVAIGDINHPFQGSVHVKSTGFEKARETLRETGN